MIDPTPILQQTLDEHPTPYIRHRAHIILLTLAGDDPSTIAKKVGVAVDTVHKWQKAWGAMGMAIFPPEVQALTAQPAKKSPQAVAEPTSEPITEAPRKSKSAKADTEPAEAEAEKTGKTGKAEKTAKADKVATETQSAKPTKSAKQDSKKSTTKSSRNFGLSDPIGEAARQILLARLARVEAEQAVAVVGEDIEGVHLMRVATRQMRSAYSLLGKAIPTAYQRKSYSRPLRRTAQLLGAVRDLDVLLLHLSTYPDQEAVQPLVNYLQKEHAAARQTLLKWLKAKEYKQFIKSYRQALRTSPKLTKASQKPIEVVLPRLVDEQLQVIYAYADTLDTAEIEQLHALRIEFKRMRYLLEFFDTLVGENGFNVIKLSKKLQDLLGDMNDADVAIFRIKAMRKKLPKAARTGAETYMASRAAEIDAIIEAFPPVWEEFLHESASLR